MTTYGYILEMPGRPDLADQLFSMRVGGVKNAAAYLHRDRLEVAKRHRNAGFEQLEARNTLRRRLEPGDRIVVADTLCLGVSDQDVIRFMEFVKDRGASVRVIKARDINPDKDDMSALGAEFQRDLIRFKSARSRGRV